MNDPLYSAVSPLQVFGFQLGFSALSLLVGGFVIFFMSRQRATRGARVAAWLFGGLGILYGLYTLMGMIAAYVGGPATITATLTETAQLQGRRSNSLHAIFGSEAAFEVPASAFVTLQEGECYQTTFYSTPDIFVFALHERLTPDDLYFTTEPNRRPASSDRPRYSNPFVVQLKLLNKSACAGG